MAGDDRETPILVNGHRLLFVAPSAYPLGGVQVWLDYVSEGLDKRGWQVTQGLVSGRHHDIEAYLRVHPWPRVIRIENSTGSPQGRINAVREALRQTRPDLLLVVNQAAVYETVRRMRSEGEGTPRVVMTLHGLQGDLFGDIAAEKDVIDAVVATNRLARLLAAEALGSEDRVLYASYGVPLLAQQPGNPAKMRGDGNAARLLYAGRLAEGQKRVLDLAGLMAALRGQGVDAVLTIAGDGPDSARLRARFDKLGLNRSLCFAGILAPNELATAYSTHDALVITSEWETGPIVAWEAMSHGLPVVSSRYVGSGAEHALNNGENCLLFDVGDVDSAARAVAGLGQPALRQKLIEGGYRLVRERYSRESSVAQWDKALQMILRLPPPGPPERPAPGSPAGRLDRLLGTDGGEKVRRMLGIRFQHSEPGGEWPHSAGAGRDDEELLSLARKLDVPGSGDR